LILGGLVDLFNDRRLLKSVSLVFVGSIMTFELFLGSVTFVELMAGCVGGSRIALRRRQDEMPPIILQDQRH
jgi:hypothetical protein